MIKKTILIFTLLISLILFSCEDIFEKDITNDSVMILSPLSKNSIQSDKVTFLWELLEGADQYHIVVVSPSFENIQTYVCDSLTDKYTISLSLPAGEYEWSIQARNSAYESQKKNVSFKVERP